MLIILPQVFIIINKIGSNLKLIKTNLVYNNKLNKKSAPMELSSLMDRQEMEKIFGEAHHMQLPLDPFSLAVDSPSRRTSP